MAQNARALHLRSAQSERVQLNTDVSFRNQNRFTWEGWVKPGANAVSPHQYAWVEEHPNLAVRFAVVPVKGMLRFRFSRKQGIAPTNYTFAYEWDDYWHHIAFAADIGNERYAILLDGGVVQSGKLLNAGKNGDDQPHVIEDTVPAHTTVGANYNGSSYINYWDGKLDCVRLWSTERSANQVQSDLFDFVDVEAQTNILAEFRFEDTGSTVNGIKHSTVAGVWTGTYYRGAGATSAHTTIDRPFLGEGDIDITAPSTPTMYPPSGVTANAFQLAWTQATDDVYVQYYEVEVSTASDFSTTLSEWAARNVDKALAATVEGLAPNTNYYARVRAVDARQNASEWATYNTNQVITTLATGDRTPPSRPTLFAATGLTATSFQMSWTAASDASGVVGYKLDVATNSNFSAFLPAYRNLDVGDVLTKLIDTDLQPLTSYWVRVRAYDAAGNESLHSNTIEVTTEPLPDTEPPNIVVTIPPESVEHNRFTARWNVGVDNVAVIGYRLDVARDSAFTEFLPGYHDLDVGDVLYTNVSGCEPGTTYFYRVRAYDAAGNVSVNTDTPELAATREAALLESGVIPQGFEVTEDTHVSSASGGTNYGTAEVLALSTTEQALVKFTNLEYLGTVDAVTLRLPIAEGTAPATYTITYLGDLAWDEETVTYTSISGSLTGPSVEVTSSALTTMLSVDVTSLFNTALSQHTFLVEVDTDTGGGIYSRESVESLSSVLELELNALSVFEGLTDEHTVEDTDEYTITNYARAQTVDASKPGVVAGTGVTVTYDANDGWVGGDSYRIDYTTAETVVALRSNTALDLTNVAEARAGVRVKTAAAGQQFDILLHAVYTDATTSSAASAVFDGRTDWAGWYTVTCPVNAAKTIDYLQLEVRTKANSTSLWVDAPLIYLPLNPYTDIAWFSGDSKGAAWDGTPHTSSSSRRFTPIESKVWYIGDNNENATLTLQHRPSGTFPWYEALGSVVIDRVAKVVTSQVHGSVPFYNLCRNPGFESGTTQFWNGGEGVCLISAVDGNDQSPSSGNYCLRVDRNGHTHVRADYYFPPEPSASYSAEAKMLAPLGDDLIVNLGIWDAGWGGVAYSSFQASATGEWQTFRIEGVTNTAAGVHAILWVENTTSDFVYLDDVLIHQGATLPGPYLDGAMPSGSWQGDDHLSETDLILAPDVPYDVLLSVDDPDGVQGGYEFGGSVTIPPQLDNPLTTETVTWEAHADRLFVTATYLGDDNETATAAIDWKRADLSRWSRVVHSWDRERKRIVAEIAGLHPQTMYDVRVTFADSTNVVYGDNPITVQATTAASETVAATPARILFGGYVLMDDRRSDVWVSEHDAFDHPEREVHIERLARLDGSAEISDYWGMRRISMKGGISGSSRAELAQKLRDLRRALSQGRQRLVIDTIDSQGYFFKATCTRFNAPEIGQQTMRHLPWTAEFTCADPFRYAASETTENAVTLSTGATTIVTNDGDLPVRPQFELLALNGSQPVQITVTNETTGERITHSGTVVQDDKLVVDSERLRLLHNGVESDFQGSFPRLSVGQNTISVRLEPPVGEVQLTVRRRHKFF